MPIQALFVDVGGVLVELGPSDERSKWAARFDLTEVQLARIVFDSEAAWHAVVGAVPEAAVWEHAASVLKLNEQELAEFKRDFWKGERFNTELAQFIQTLRPHCKTGIISNAWSDARSALNSKFNLDSYVDDTIYSAEVKLAKPDVRIFQLALARLDVRPSKAVFVDDVLENVHAAQSLGMKGVQFKNTIQTIDDVKGYLDEHPAT
jgi:epoxide hydrolase-like predicted phosphatase